MRLAGHVACVGERGFAYRVSKGKLRERGNLEVIDLNIMIKIK